jgi:hypothetical protein
VHEDIKSPWAEGLEPDNPTELEAVVRAFEAEEEEEGEFKLTYGHDDGSDRRHEMHGHSIVIARTTNHKLDLDERCYVLLVTQIDPASHPKGGFYQRVGVGHKRGICMNEVGVPATVV